MLDLFSFLKILTTMIVAFAISSAIMAGIQIFFVGRSKLLADLMEGPDGHLINQRFIEEAFRRWWVPVRKLLEEKIGQNSRTL